MGGRERKGKGEKTTWGGIKKKKVKHSRGKEKIKRGKKLMTVSPKTEILLRHVSLQVCDKRTAV